jgi:hypothetical protein
MNEFAECTFCAQTSTHYITGKRSKNLAYPTNKEIICFSCIETVYKLMKKAIIIENQLSMAYFEKPKGI